MTPITVALLREHGACESGIASFAAAFPEGLVPAEDEAGLAEQAAAIVAAKLDVGWGAEVLFSIGAMAEYERALATAWSEYRSETSDARRAYERGDTSTWDEYERATATAAVKRERFLALAFLRAYRGQP